MMACKWVKKNSSYPEKVAGHGGAQRSGGHLSVGIITVGGEEDLGHLLNAAQEDGQVGLWTTPFCFQYFLSSCGSVFCSLHSRL